MKPMPAREVASLVWTAMSGGTKLAAKTLLSIRRGKGQVKKGSRLFYKTLIESGIPKENALAIAKSYATPGYEMLSIRNLIRMARDLD
ncbi:MAG: hypothetical protein ACTSUO_01805 [Candidatus Thorarchaeota archaeon]